EQRLVTLMESSLRELLDDARFPTLETWVATGMNRRADAPVVDLAAAELAFRKGERFIAEAFAAHAGPRFPEGHSMTSRAYSLAGTSAHLSYRTEIALEYHREAQELATTTADHREALWGQLISLLNLEDPSAENALLALEAQRDGSIESEMRL